MTGQFVVRTAIRAPAKVVFDWHKRPDAFERLVPPWQRVDVVERSGHGISPGTRVVLRFRKGPFYLTWVAEHTEYIEGKIFRDVQVCGPFAKWEHTHRVIPNGPESCFLEDAIDYESGSGWRGWLVCPLIVREMDRVFEYRHRVTREALEGKQVSQGAP